MRPFSRQSPILLLLLLLLLQKHMFRVALSDEIAAGPLYKNIKTVQGA